MTSSPSLTDQRLEERLRAEPTVWLSSIRPDGRPHVVPVWFSWNGHVVDLFSKPTAQKVRNVRAHPDVMLAIGQPRAEWDVELIEGRGTVLPESTARVIDESMFDKYRALMVTAGLDRSTFVLTYSQPVRIVPTRVIGYGGKGWGDPSLSIDGEDDVTGHQASGMVDELRQAHIAAILRTVAAAERGAHDGRFDGSH